MAASEAGRTATPDRRHELWECGCSEGYIHSGTELRCDVCGKANPHRESGRTLSLALTVDEAEHILDCWNERGVPAPDWWERLYVLWRDAAHPETTPARSTPPE